MANIRQEHLTRLQWNNRHQIVRAYHGSHTRMNKEPFVKETTFSKLTMAEFDIMLDWLEALGARLR